MAHPFSLDILAEILKRLPLKSVLQSRCVEKSWYHLIGSPFFINLHCNHHNKRSKLLLFQNRYHTLFSIRPDNKQWEKFYRPHLRFPPLRCMPEWSYCQNIYGTSRGLVCFSITICCTQEEQLYIWNPVINKFRSLPKSPQPSNDPPCSHDKGLAFGYIGQIDDYKVIKLDISYHAQSEELQSDYASVYIYSLSTNSWKTVGKYDFAQFRSYLLYNSVVVNGVAYWVLRKWILEENDGYRDFQVIICFDTVKEIIREIMLPPSSTDNRCAGYVNLVGEFGEVSLLCVDIVDGDIICKLWNLEKEDETNKVWTNMISVNLSYVDDEYRFPIGFNNNLEFVLIKHSFEKPGFCSYDPGTKEVREMVNDSSDLWAYADFEDPENPRIGWGYVTAFGHYLQEHMQPMYVNSFDESLVLLGEEDEVEFIDD